MRYAITIWVAFGMALMSRCLIFIWAPTTTGQWRCIVDVMDTAILLLAALSFACVIWVYWKFG